MGAAHPPRRRDERRPVRLIHEPSMSSSLSLTRSSRPGSPGPASTSPCLPTGACAHDHPRAGPRRPLLHAQLLAEARARVPVHTPEWTNLNESDPGVTMLELFAFLTDNLLYRSNRIPEATRYHVPHAPRHGAAAGDCGERAGDVQCRRTDHGARRRRSSAPARSGSVRDARCRRCRSRHTCCGSARTPTWTTRPSSTCAGCTSRSSEPTARIS